MPLSRPPTIIFGRTPGMASMSVVSVLSEVQEPVVDHGVRNSISNVNKQFKGLKDMTENLPKHIEAVGQLVGEALKRDPFNRMQTASEDAKLSHSKKKREQCDCVIEMMNEAEANVLQAIQRLMAIERIVRKGFNPEDMKKEKAKTKVNSLANHKDFSHFPSPATSKSSSPNKSDSGQESKKNGLAIDISKIVKRSQREWNEVWEKIQADDLSKGPELNVASSYTVSGTHIWLHYDWNTASDLNNTLQIKCQEMLRKKMTLDKDSISYGTLCAAKYSVDGNWYRAKIKDVRNESEVCVDFIDYGNPDTVTKGQLLPLDEHMIFNYKVQAVKCSIQGYDDSLDDMMRIGKLLNKTWGLWAKFYKDWDEFTPEPYFTPRQYIVDLKVRELDGSSERAFLAVSRFG